MEMTDRIKLSRLLAGLTSEDLAAKLKITRMNVVRWQSTGLLPLRQVKPFANATGVPEQWLRSGGELQGLVIARPLRVDSRSAKNVQRSNAKYLAEMLPRLCPGATVSALRGASGTAYMFTAQQYCLVVFALVELGLDLGHVDLKQESIDEAIWFAAYSGKKASVMELLCKAGLDAWAKEMQNTPDTPQALKIHRLEIIVQNADTEQMVVEKLSRFVQELIQLGGCEVKIGERTENNRQEQW